MYTLRIAKRAEKFLTTIPSRALFKIMEVIEKLKKEPRSRWVEKLKGLKNGESYRTSWGKYRIIYTIEDRFLPITVVSVDGRDDVYKKLKRKLQ